MNVISSYLGGVRHHENQVSCLRRLIGTMFLCRLESGPLLKTYVCSLVFVCLFVCLIYAEQRKQSSVSILPRKSSAGICRKCLINFLLELLTFMMDATSFSLHCGSNISNKRGTVSSHFQSLRWQLKMSCNAVFLVNFEGFESAMRGSLECLKHLLNNWP